MISVNTASLQSKRSKTLMEVILKRMSPSITYIPKKTPKKPNLIIKVWRCMILVGWAGRTAEEELSLRNLLRKQLPNQHTNSTAFCLCCNYGYSPIPGTALMDLLLWKVTPNSKWKPWQHCTQGFRWFPQQGWNPLSHVDRVWLQNCTMWTSASHTTSSLGFN